MSTTKKIYTGITLILLVGILSYGLFIVTKPAYAASIIVNSNLDGITPTDGNCTLREAIENANTDSDVSGGDCIAGSGSDVITFSGALIIAPVSPYIITSPITIDGVSGIPGLSCGDIIEATIPRVLGVEIDGTAVGGGSVFEIGTGASGSTIHGLVIRIDVVGSTAISITDVSGVQPTTVSCSLIGLDQSGTNAKSFINGIHITDSSNIIIGGSTMGQGNVISASNRAINSADGDDLIVQGNILGLDVTGTTIPYVGQAVGINILDDGTLAAGRSTNIKIGGSLPQERNIISGYIDSIVPNTGQEISIYDVEDLRIQGNYIGTDRTGLIGMGGTNGITLSIDNPGQEIHNVVVGGSNPGEGNLISGHSFGAGGYSRGLVIGDYENPIPSNNVSDITVFGNFFGVDVTGLADILVNPNSADNISTHNTSNIQIGGTGVNERNIISGVSDNGNEPSVVIANSRFVTVTNNYIGVDKNNVNPIPQAHGIIMRDSQNITIGGNSVAEQNIIANSNFYGVGLLGNITDTIIQKNSIHNNGIAGIALIQTTLFPGTIAASIIDNSIYNNTGMGIDILKDVNGDFNPDPEGPTGPNLNDIGDSDTGANNHLNYPVIHSITESPLGTLNLNYYLDAPVGSYRVEFYKNPTAGLDSSYHGEGEEFVFADTFTSTGTIGSKSISFPGALTDVITPTATECTDGTCTAFVRTSEFGPTVPITAGGGSGAGLDFGDVTTNQTTALNNGAYHILNTNYLGSCVDADTGVNQNNVANFDDTTAPTDPSAVVGVCATPNDDEDGVTFDKLTYTTGESAVLTVTASAPGIVNVWVDANNNGSFLDAGEQVLVNTAVAAGSNTLAGFTVPATNGTYPLRVRYTSSINAIYQESPGVASPRGEALDGEVEDYNLQVGPLAVVSGCTNPLATNYNPLATVDNGSCIIPTSGGWGSSGGMSDLCLNIPNVQSTVPAGYVKDMPGNTPGACAPVTINPTDPKKYTVDIYPLNDTGITPPPTSDTCPYFTKYLKLGKKNDQTEVIKWQNFLNTHMKESLTINGIYNTETYNAVKRFQSNYRADVLTPWGLNNPTGWTYKTTRMKANQIVGCLEKPVFLEIPKISWVLGRLN
jgi:hypothetical protein